MKLILIERTASGVKGRQIESHLKSVETFYDAEKKEMLCTFDIDVAKHSVEAYARVNIQTLDVCSMAIYVTPGRCILADDSDILLKVKLERMVQRILYNTVSLWRDA